LIVMPTNCKRILEYKKTRRNWRKTKIGFMSVCNNYTAEIYKRKHEDVTGFKMVDFIDFIL